MAKKTTKSKETFTVKDFKMWLKGLTEFQEANWTPNAKQWKTILEKVEMLEDNVQYVTAPAPQPQAHPVRPVQPQFEYYEEDDDRPQVVGGGFQQPTARFQQPDYIPAPQPAARQLGAGDGIIQLDITQALR